MSGKVLRVGYSVVPKDSRELPENVAVRFHADGKQALEGTMPRTKLLFPLVVNLTLSTLAHAEDFAKLDEALPSDVDALAIAPVFDFDGDGCLPSAGISRDGEMNAGLNTSGGISGGCRSSNFLDTSNTMHRHACVVQAGSEYCAHVYALYFEKDQILDGIGFGHRHDWEYAAIWTRDGVITHGSYSAHGDLFTDVAENLPFDDGHLKVVYHKDGLSTHAMRFAAADEPPENPYGAFVTPTIASWFELHGDGIGNAAMRELLTGFDYGSANLPLIDTNFISDINAFRPASYPAF